MAQGQWQLCDVEERNRRFPDTFELPPVLVRWNLRPGQVVKLIFTTTTKTGLQGERMWVEVLAEILPGQYRGRLRSKPLSVPDLQKGTEILFGPQHVALILEEEP